MFKQTNRRATDDERDAPNPFSLKSRLVPKDATFGSATKAAKAAKRAGKKPVIIFVLHPPSGSIHRIQTRDGITEDFHGALVRGGYVHRRPDLWSSVLNSPSHVGRGIHIVHRDGFYVDGANISRGGSRPVPHGATFGRAMKHDDVSADYNGKPISANDSRVAAALAADAE